MCSDKQSHYSKVFNDEKENISFTMIELLCNLCSIDNIKLIAYNIYCLRFVLVSSKSKNQSIVCISKHT